MKLPGFYYNPVLETVMPTMYSFASYNDHFYCKKNLFFKVIFNRHRLPVYNNHKNYSMKFLKPILAGILIGAALFFMPFFVLRVVIVFLIIGALFRLFAGRRFGRGYGRGFHHAYADNIRNMSDEEYKAFKQSNTYSCGWHNTRATDESNMKK